MYALAMVRALVRARRGLGFFEPQLETHHEVDPVAWLSFQSLDDRPYPVFS